MVKWLYKWLPRCFGCHCRPERSLFWRGKQFPLCARCSGELVGIIVALSSFWFVSLNVSVSLFLLVPMLIDGFVQLWTRYESTNRRRLVTGTLFGYGLIALHLHSLVWTFQLGGQLRIYIEQLHQ